MTATLGSAGGILYEPLAFLQEPAHEIRAALCLGEEGNVISGQGIFADRSWRVPEPNMIHGNTALLLVDLQYYDAHPDHGIIKEYLDKDRSSLNYYLRRLRDEVIPNAQKLLHAFRQTRMEVIYTRIQALTRDGRDRSLEHKNLKFLVPPGSKEAEILEALSPLEDEIVISKTCGSPFNGSNIDYVLRNLGVENLVVCGVVTSGCVEMTACDAVERGYGVTVVRDAVATWTSEMEEYSLRRMGDSFAKVKTADQAIDLVRTLSR